MLKPRMVKPHGSLGRTSADETEVFRARTCWQENVVKAN